MLVDSHCHLDFPQLAEQEADVVQRARDASVEVMLTISTRLSTFNPVLELAERYNGVYVATGVHPHNAGEEGPDDAAALIANSGHAKVIAIGECGLDYYYDHAPRDKQKQGFEAHIDACRQTGLPLIVHTRDADADTQSILKDELQKGPYRGVIHCYSSSPELGHAAVDLGFMLGIGGILTFKRSDELRATVEKVPRDRILLETDSPYLAPVPKRGKTNEPAYVAHVARQLAEIWSTDIDTVAQQTTNNFFSLFTKAERPSR